MMMIGIRSLPLSAALLLLPAAAMAQQPATGSLRVRVIDELTRLPVEGAQIVFPELYRFWITDAGGWATATEIPLGAHEVEFTSDGHLPLSDTFEFTAGVEAEGQVVLSPAAEEPIEVRVTATTGNSSASLRVRVADSTTGSGLDGAQITFLDLERFWVTDRRGFASISDLPPGEHPLEISMLGFASLSARAILRPGSVAEAEFTMTPVVLEVAGIEVTVRSSPFVSPRLQSTGFYNRYRRGLGRQFTRPEIRNRLAFVPSDLFRGIPGVRLRQGERPGHMIPVTNAQSLTQPGDCPISVYLDGIRWTGVIDEVPIDWIEGFEVYLGPSEIPAKYGATAESCGVALIWTG